MDDSMLNERAVCRSRLQELDESKAMDLKHKARCKWQIEGDENTSFFHGLVNSNIKCNRVNGLNIDGIWVSDPKIIKEKVFSFFSDKYREPLPIRPKFSSNKFKRLSHSDRDMLEEQFNPEEIKHAVWQCGNDKAPGPD